MNSTDLTRRRLMGMVLTGVATSSLLRLAPAEAADLPHLSPTDPTASAMQYIEDVAKIDAKKSPAFKAGSKCANCTQYTGPATGFGPCNIFPGKDVAADGWCAAYMKKA